MQFTNTIDILKSYNVMYKDIFFSECNLLEIFNDTYDTEKANLTNDGLLLNLGHYFSLKKNDIRRATWYYDKLKSKKSSLGLYSLAVFYYLAKLPSRARMYALNGINVTGSCVKCTILLTKIFMEEQKYESAEEYLLKEIQQSCNKQNTMKLYEHLCYVHVESKNDKKFNDLSCLLCMFGTITADITRCNYYLNKHDFDSLGYYSQDLMNKHLTFGNYFMGMLNYKKMLITCVSGKYTNDEIIELILIASLFLENVINDDKCEYDILKINSQKVLDILEIFSDKLN